MIINNNTFQGTITYPLLFRYFQVGYEKSLHQACNSFFTAASPEAGKSSKRMGDFGCLENDIWEKWYQKPNPIS